MNTNAEISQQNRAIEEISEIEKAADMPVFEISEIEAEPEPGVELQVDAGIQGDYVDSNPDIVEVVETPKDTLQTTSLGAVNLGAANLEVARSEAIISEAVRSEIVQDIKDNEAWLTLVSSLSLESVLSGIAHSLVFKNFDGINLVLERPISVKAFRVDEAEVRLALAISSKLGKDISCKIEYVENLQEENLHERTERLDEERFNNALDDYKQDAVVQYLQNELQATLLEKTLKPID